MALTEREILDCLKDSLKITTERCQDLADGRRGKTYREFKDAMKLVDGCCRQMSGWREDTRWSAFALKVFEVPKRTAKWLREDKKSWHAKFAMLADILRAAQVRAMELERKKTGKVGLILPPVLTPPTRTQGRQILVPEGYKDIRNRKAS